MRLTSALLHAKLLYMCKPTVIAPELNHPLTGKGESPFTCMLQFVSAESGEAANKEGAKNLRVTWAGLEAVPGGWGTGQKNSCK